MRIIPETQSVLYLGKIVISTRNEKTRTRQTPANDTAQPPSVCAEYYEKDNGLSPFSTSPICSREAKNKSWQRDWWAKKFAAIKLDQFLLFYSVRANKFAYWKDWKMCFSQLVVRFLIFGLMLLNSSCLYKIIILPFPHSEGQQIAV